MHAYGGKELDVIMVKKEAEEKVKVKKKKKEQEMSYEQILRIIDLCKAVEREGFDPFKVDVKSSLKTLKKYLPEWKEIDDLLLDMEAIRRITELIRLQGEWIKHRASGLYVDPMLVELKLRTLPAEKLASMILLSTHPIANLEQVSPAKLIQALDYWNRLASLKSRMTNVFPETSFDLGDLSLDDLVQMQVLGEEEFQDSMQGLWEELRKAITGHDGTKNIPYWEFVGRESYEDSVRRAYLTTFLVSEGYARIEVDPLKEAVYLVPNERQQPPPEDVLPRSIAISFDSEGWQKKLLEERKDV